MKSRINRYSTIVLAVSTPTESVAGNATTYMFRKQEYPTQTRTMISNTGFHPVLVPINSFSLHDGFSISSSSSSSSSLISSYSNIENFRCSMH